MAYDYHGGWDTVTGPHTALHSSDGLNTEHALDLYIAAGVPPSKIVCGLALYGRAWTLQRSDVIAYGVATAGLARPGVCTQEAGVLNQLEIKSLVGDNCKVDKDTQTVIGWSGDQFVTFDNEETIGSKIEYYCKRGLGGVMSWAMSMDEDYHLLQYIYNKASQCSSDSNDFVECMKYVTEGEECFCID